MLLKVPFLILIPTFLQSQADAFSPGQSHCINYCFLARIFCLQSWLSRSTAGSVDAAVRRWHHGDTIDSAVPRAAVLFFVIGSKANSELSVIFPVRA